jgi:hypothetical protein
MADCFGSLKNLKNFFPRPPNIPILLTEMNLKRSTSYIAKPRKILPPDRNHRTAIQPSSGRTMEIGILLCVLITSTTTPESFNKSFRSILMICV